MKELAKHYDPKLVEKDKYEHWKNSGYFLAGDNSKPRFSMVLPPPNVTGKLHLGHAWDTTFQDVIARYKKARGYDVLWLPGMDHAGIATQAVVEAKLRKEGTSRYDLGREKFLEKAWEWKDEYATTIRSQWKKMGLALDYSRERFTLDDNINRAVRKVFVDLYNKGLIYQGERIINWDPAQQTALSNIEVIHKDIKGKFYHFAYVAKDDPNFHLNVATTRPETMFADVCLVVNPQDDRYTKYLGKEFINPVNGQVIPLIADDYVDVAFGTGVMKCTPAHDANDFVIGEKYGLKMPMCINKDGSMNELALEFKGQDRFECRKNLVEKMKSLGLLLEVKEHTHNVGHSERSNAIVEPYLSKQWFIKMRPLALQALENQETKGKVDFFPKRFNKTFTQWMDKAEDWCISRQLWWGHRIPAYFHKTTGEILVSIDEPSDSENYYQDEDVLDTWFSSALWPFTTLGWPNQTDDLKRYFPLDTMVTGYDIIFFWVSRMIFQSLEFTGQAPFKDVVIHGLIRDRNGRKMSKSLGNGVDPSDVIEQYGTDSLRYFLATNSTPGQDSRFIEEKVVSSVNYLNKIWNAARYILMNLPSDYTPQKIDFKQLNPVDKYILTRLDKTVKNVAKYMDKYELGLASNYLYNFVYDDFCSQYLEMSKVVLQNTENKQSTYDVLYHSLKSIIMMIYPFSPFISEELYLHLPHHKESIMLDAYPNIMKLRANRAEKDTDEVITIIKQIRNFKANNNVAPNEKIDIYLTDLTFDLNPYNAIIKRIAFVNDIYVSQPDEVLPFVVLASGKLSFKVLIDVVELRNQLESDLARLEKEISRSEAMLNNVSFMAKAPEFKVKAEKEKYDNYKKAFEEIKTRLQNLK
ncbi:MAG TPA: valine--tRNA ligase [Bacilli bacterium]|nr:valine--tRNA ligase [Bacilli bacterium]